MSDADLVLADALRAAGLESVSVFQVRTVDAFRKAVESMELSGRPQALTDFYERSSVRRELEGSPQRRFRLLAERLWHDLAFRDLGGVWNEALREDNERRLDARLRSLRRVGLGRGGGGA